MRKVMLGGGLSREKKRCVVELDHIYLGVELRCTCGGGCCAF